MKRAIISDIHGNLEALQAVLADARGQGVDDIFCLGDIIGYGPNPCECLDLIIESCRVCLLGNHDQGALFDPEGFNTGAERAIFWTRDQLENPRGDRGSIVPAALMNHCHAVVGFWLIRVVQRPDLFVPSLEETLGWIASGDLQLTVGATYPLENAAEAHADLEGRKTTGKLILNP